MTRYIDADEMSRKFAHYGEPHMYDAFDLDDMLAEMQTIDAVEVVRCEDCRYFKKIAERSDSGLCHRDIVASAWKENGYCSRGERRKP